MTRCYWYAWHSLWGFKIILPVATAKGVANWYKIQVWGLR